MEDHGHLRVQDDGLEWTVTERVLVKWHDDKLGQTRCLGRLSSHNRTSAFTLCVGQDLQRRQILIAFHLPIKLHASSSKLPKHMYLVVPVESLEVEASSPEVVRALDLPKTTLDTLRNAGLVQPNDSSRIIRVSFKLNRPGYVVMPKIKTKPVKGTPRDLLLSFRSLADTLSFDVFLKFNTYAKVELQKICDDLHERFSTATLDLQSMYYGRGAVLDAWENYPFVTDGAKKAPFNPLAREATPPPPYEHASSALPLLAEAASIEELSPECHPTQQPREAPSLRVSLSNSTAMLIPCSDDDIASVQAQQSEEYGSHVTETSASQSPLTTGDVAANNDQFRVQQSRQEYVEEPWVLEQQPIHRQGDHQRHLSSSRGCKRKAIRHTPSSDEGIGDWLGSSSSLLKKAPSRRKLDHVRFQSRMVAAATAGDEPAAAPIQNACAKQLSPSLVPAINNALDSAVTPGALLAEMVAWLISAWTISPEAHKAEQLYDELLVLGKAARHGDLRAFDAAMITCSTKLAVQAADERLSQPLGSGAEAQTSNIDDLEARIKDVVCWARGINRAADTMLLRELSELASAGRRGNHEDFVKQKAYCIGVVLFSWALRNSEESM